MVPELLLLDLESGMVDPFLSANVGQLLQHCCFLPLAREHMGDQDRLSGSEIPDVQIVYINHSFGFLKLFLHLLQLQVRWSRLHDDLVAVLGDGPGRNQDDDAEDVGGDGIAVVPVIPIRYFVAHIGSEKEDYERRND